MHDHVEAAGCGDLGNPVAHLAGAHDTEYLNVHDGLLKFGK